MAALLKIPYECCPLCEGPLHEIVRYGCTNHPLYDSRLPGILTWVHCDRCGHECTDSYYSPEGLGILFSHTNSHQELNLTDLERFRALFALSIDRLRPYLSSSFRSWLDVGCGNGALLAVAQEYGFAVTGLELREDAAEKVRVRGFDVHAIDILEYSPTEKFQVISLMDVLEHIPFPLPVVAHLRNLVAEDGVVIISCPNSEHLLWDMLTEAKKNPYWAEIEHCHNFSRTRLISIMAAQGFEAVRYSISERYRLGMEILFRKTP